MSQFTTRSWTGDCRARLSTAVIVIGFLTATRPAFAQFGSVRLVSIASDGTPGNHDSDTGFVSANGRFVVFGSQAWSLVPGDTNQWPDVFVSDLLLGVTERVSVGAGGVQSNNSSGPRGLSWDGGLILYATGATNIIVPDQNGPHSDFVLRNRVTGAQQFVTLSNTGAQGDHDAYGGRITPDARYVVFASHSTNLVLNDTNGATDIFVRDIALSITTRENVSTAGIEANDYSNDPAISADGRFAAFWSHATNLVPGDTNGLDDTFVRDRFLGITRRVSVASSGAQAVLGGGTVAISSSGRFVAFDSFSPDLVPNDLNGRQDVFVHDLVLGTTIAVSVTPQGLTGNGNCETPTISADGRFVAFASQATNYVSPSFSSLDVYVRDMQIGVTRRASQNAIGQQGNGQDRDPQISPDGRFVCMRSWSNNLAPGDTNNFSDTLLQESPFTNPYQYCVNGSSTLGCAPILSTTGLPSASSSAPFLLRVDGVPSHSMSLSIYGITSPAQIPFHHSWLCVAPPLRRAMPLGTGGSTPQFDCTGAYLADFNARIQSGIDPALIVGQRVWLQVWTGDRLGSMGVLSQALAFDITQ